MKRNEGRMRARRIASLKKQGFEVVDSLPSTLALPEGDTTPFRQTAAPVVAHYAPLTMRERWAMAANFAIGGTRPIELSSTDTHLYGRFAGVGGHVFARIPRAALRVRWRQGATTLYGLADGSALAVASRDGDALLAALDAEIVSRPDAPFRNEGTMYQRALQPTLSTVIIVSSMQGISWYSVGFVALFSLLTSWVLHNRVEVTREGLTIKVGVFPTWTRFVPRERVHAVVLRVDKRPFATFLTTEIEVRDAKNVPTNYVIARARTTEPGREYAERELAPEARRVAALLGCRGPRWDV